MKIGIITYHRAHNYGALLQAIATRTILSKMGHDVIYIDYWPLYHKSKYRVFSLIQFRYHKFPYLWHCLKNIRFIKKRISVFKQDINKYILPFCRKEREGYDAIIYGSDQIWRFQHEIQAYNKTYFAATYKAPIQVAFAASMGVICKNPVQKKNIASWLSNFTSIGVREDELFKFVQDCGYNCVQNIDPTLCLSAKEWDCILETKPIIKEGYVLYYSLNEEDFDRNMIESYANSQGLRIVEITGKAVKPSECIYSLATLCEFVSLIKYADTVFASSFHGTVFSIIYHKQFWSSFSYSPGRVRSLLMDLGIVNHLIPARSTKLPYSTPIDFEVVEDKLDVLRTSSMNYLCNSLIHKSSMQ